MLFVAIVDLSLILCLKFYDLGLLTSNDLKWAELLYSHFWNKLPSSELQWVGVHPQFFCRVRMIRRSRNHCGSESVGGSVGIGLTSPIGPGRATVLASMYVVIYQRLRTYVVAGGNTTRRDEDSAPPIHRVEWCPHAPPTINSFGNAGADDRLGPAFSVHQLEQRRRRKRRKKKKNAAAAGA